MSCECATPILFLCAIWDLQSDILEIEKQAIYPEDAWRILWDMGVTKTFVP